MGPLSKFFMDHKASAEWATRRRIIILTLIWAAGLITYISVIGRDISVNEAIATNLIFMMGGVIGSYVFGAVWDDQSRRKTEVAQSAVDQGDPTNTTVKLEP